MKRVLSILTTIILMIGTFPLQALADTDAAVQGDGSASYPYIVMTLEQLNSVRNDLTAQYRLGADIDASETIDWNGGNGFEPIGGNGDSASQFTGVFDGAGHIIRNLTVNRPATDLVGLFGIVGPGGIVRDVGLDGGSVTGKLNTGGLAGRNLGEVASSFVTGSVSSSEGVVGGLVGYSGIGSTVNASYASGAVDGPVYVGGLVGRNDGAIRESHASGTVSGIDIVGGLAGGNEGGQISQSYAAGTVNGSGNNAGGLVGYNLSGIVNRSYAIGDVNGQINVGGLAGNTDFGGISESYATGSVNGQVRAGGLIGQNNGGELTDSFWDRETTLQSSACGYNNEGYPGTTCTATALAVAEALTQSSYSAWDFTNVWFMIDGATRPFLRSEWSRTIGNAHQLQLMAMNVSADYTLARDIDFGAVLTDDSRSDMWATGSGIGAGFAPVGSDYHEPFTGKFDGANQAIKNLRINRPDADFVGLFGYLGSGGVVRNVGLEGGFVSGRYSTGALVGESYGGTIVQAYSSVDVSGDSNVGGVVGQNNIGGIVRQSFATGPITGQFAVGGLTGRNEKGTINDAYSTGSVNGSSEVGGLVGRNVGSINRAYAVGRVTANGGSVGGLVGRNFEPVIASAYDSQTSGHGDADKGTPTMTAEMKQRATFESNWDFVTIWTIEEGRTYPTLRGAALSVGVDVAPPTVASAAIKREYGDRILVTFDEEVRIADASGVLIESDEIGQTIVNVEGDGTKTLTFIVADAFEQGAAVTLSYNAQLGSIVDLAGNSMHGLANLTVYKSPSLEIEMKKADGSAYGSDEWTNASVTVSVYADAGDSEIAALVYTLDGGPEQAYTNGTPIELSEEGIHTISFQAADRAGNTISDRLTVKIDMTAPAVDFDPTGNETASASAAVQTTVSDSGSRVDASSLKYAWTTDISPPAAGWISFANEAALTKSGADGDWYLHIRAADMAGNEAFAVAGRFRLIQHRTESGTSPGTGGYEEAALPDNVYSIGVNGREVRFEGGRIVIPAGAMNRLFRLSINEIRDTSRLPFADGQRLASKVIEFTKDQAGKFDRDVTVSLRFNAESIRREDAEVSLCWLDEELGRWLPLDNRKADWEKGEISGTINHFAKFAVLAIPVGKEEPAVRFTDIQGHWAETFIMKLVETDAVGGYADGSFRPDRPITRAEFAAIWVRVLGLSDKKGKTFADTVNHWSEQAVSTAYAHGIITGYDDRTFAPDEFITREQMAVMIVNALQSESVPARKKFADQSEISPWAKDAVLSATESGFLTGYPDNTMRPRLHSTRAEAVSTIWRSVQD
ncbi:S-layer homology domain-containing protein [Cohnella sp. LGH]|uniref:S-layer homology domain-containing protein n=1 Tax=Cohnella sp. LGH TaxID=1619153 RepID=UPI001AD9845C|nr:S-layer homology domain-containing protein [Cohnella sp. LGH]QTH40615.1 S-layer homology domain-containing protein [Cohnella sp. LGH]